MAFERRHGRPSHLRTVLLDRWAPRQDPGLADKERNNHRERPMRTQIFVRLTGFAVILAMSVLLTVPKAAATKSNSVSSGFYDSAIGLTEKGDFRGAIIQLKNALQADPDDLSARILLGRTYLKVGDGASAAKELLRARRDGARDRFVLVPLGEAYLRHGLYARVLKEIRTAGQDARTAARIEVVRGQAQLGMQEYEEAEKSFISALKTLPDDEKALVGMTRLKMGVGDLSAATRYSKWALEANANNADAWFLKGEIARLQRDPEKSLASYNRALELEPQSVQALLGRGGILIALERHDEAEPNIVEARSLNPRLARAAYLHYLILQNRGQPKKAKEALVEADLILQAFPGEVVRSHPPTMLLSGIVSFFLKKEDAAYRHLTRYLERLPHHDGARKILATIALKRGENAAALRLLEPLVIHLTKDVEFLNLYGDTLIRSRRLDDAIKILGKAATVGKPGSPGLFRTITLFIAAGRDDRAVVLLQGEIAHNPKALQPALTLVTTYMRQRKFDAALKTIETAIKRHPNQPAVYNLAGGAHLAMQNIDAARASFNRAIQINPDYLQALFNLAKLEGGAGDVDAARKHFASILEKDPRNGDVMLTLARLHRSEDDIGGAVRWLEKARTASREGKRAVLRLINLYLEIGKADDALVLAQQIQRENPENLDFLAALGRAQMAAKKLERAVQTFQQLANQAVETKSLDWLRRVAIWQQWVRDSGAARNTLERALVIDKKFIPAHYELFRLDLAAGYLDAAMDRARTVALLKPDASTSHQMMGDVHMRRNAFANAVRAYQSAFKKSPNTRLATKLYQARRAAGQRALSFVVDWAKKNVADDGAQRLLAIAYADAGKNRKAAGLFERLLSKAPQDSGLLNNIALLYQKLGDPKALDFAQRALAREPNRPEFMDTYAWLLVQRGEAGRGLRILRNAQLRSPDSPDIRYHIAVALNALGQKDEALREVRAVIESGKLFDGISDARRLFATLSSEKR